MSLHLIMSVSFIHVFSMSAVLITGAALIVDAFAEESKARVMDWEY